VWKRTVKFSTSFELIPETIPRFEMNDVGTRISGPEHSIFTVREDGRDAWIPENYCRSQDAEAIRMLYTRDT
jgi:hypothetical protein